MSFKLKSLLAVIICFSLLLVGCNNNSTGSEISNSSSSTVSVPEADFAANDSEMFTDRDHRTEYSDNSTVITLSGNTAASTSSSVEISGSTVTIKDEGTYIISGELSDGMIIVDAEDTDKPQLVFDGVNITSSSSAALYILEADKVFVTLADDSENALSSGESFTAIDENNIDGAVFSKQDLTFNGSGSLTVSAPAGHGIVCKDDLVFAGGSYTVNSSAHGLDANDSVRITNSTFTVDAGKDGIHSENSDDSSLGFIYISGGSFDIEAEGDGISAAYYMQIEDGSFNILSGGGSENAANKSSSAWGDFMGGGKGGHGGMEGGMFGRSAAEDTAQIESTESSDDSSTSIKGIKSTGSMLINGGSFTINSADDSVHSNSSITVNSGKFDIASGDDAFHADASLTITGGTINITESYEGLEALNVTVSGGNITLVASDDGVNAAGGTDNSGTGGLRGGDSFGGRGGMGGMSSSSNGSIIISGGELNINSSGDGMDANGYIEIIGGYTTIVGPTQGDTATLDYDTTATISGGTFIGTGASGMAQTFSSSSQGVIAVSVGTNPAGTEITLTDKSGNTVITHSPELSFQVVILSSPDIITGETYTITVGEASGEFEAE